MTAPEMDPRPTDVDRGAVVIAWVAIGFGVVSVPGALIYLPGVSDTPLFDLAIWGSVIAPFTATISWLLALTAALIAGGRLLRPPRSATAKRALALAAPGAILGTAAIAVFAITVANFFGVIPGDAERQGERALNHYLDEGATLYCFDENNGHGINSDPWYSGYLDAPAGLGDEATARVALALAGYTETRRAEVSSYYDLPSRTESFVVESVETRSQENVEREESPLAEITVFTDGPVSLGCRQANGEYGEDVTPADGRVIIHVNVHLESTR